MIDRRSGSPFMTAIPLKIQPPATMEMKFPRFTRQNFNKRDNKKGETERNPNWS